LASPGATNELDASNLVVQQDIHCVQVQAIMKGNYKKIFEIFEEAQRIIDQMKMSGRDIEKYIKSTRSLGAAYSAQKKFFKLIDEFKRVELEMQQLLRGAIEQGETHEDFYVELEESEAKMIIIEESHLTRKEGWLEWLDELL
jgi:hypothetical protein